MELEQLKNKVLDTVVEPLISFMEDCDDCGYTREDVEKCESLIHTYLDTLSEMAGPSDEMIMDQVRALVLALNALNEQADYSLIETEVREAIWAIIQTSTIDCGLKEYSEDITEEWREW